jgi:Uma2 family endonuclease
MNSMARRQEPITPDEYFEHEAASPVRHEYVEGYLYALADVSNRHDRIVVNLIIALGSRARGTECHVHTGEMMVRVSESRYYYPDVHVGCQFISDDARTNPAPCVVIEVLSPTTTGVDRREKLFAYRQIESLRAYLIVHQEEKMVEQHWLDNGVWRHDILDGEATAHVPCLDFDLPLNVIFEGIVFNTA